MLQRLRLTARIETPIAGVSPLMLDGVLFGVHRGVRRAPTRATPVEHLLRACELRHPSQWIAHHHGVPLASAMLGQWKLERTDLVQRRDAEDVEALSRSVDRGSGPGRDKMIPVVLRCASEVHWDLIGKRREIMSLCQNVTAIGSLLRDGYGIVKDWACDPCNDAEPIWRDGISQRALPLSWCRITTAQDRGAVEPPYWHPGRFVFRVPPFTRCELSDAAPALSAPAPR